MYIGTFINSMLDGHLWALLNVCWWASKIYATTGRMLFYLLCWILSEDYINIKKEIDSLAHVFVVNGSKIELFPAMADRLTKLANKYSLVYECVEQLNISFGHFLLFEITYIFVSQINSTMYMLSDLFSVSSDWLSILIIVVWNIYALINFSILCFSSHRIGNDVSPESVIVTHIIQNKLFFKILN